MAKRIYWQSTKKYALSVGLPSGIVGFALLFIYLSTIGAIEVISHSGDIVCEGTVENPCLAFIEFKANEDIFLYPLQYDPWNRLTPFQTDKDLESWKMYRSWGSGWREIDLYDTCKGTWCGGKYGSSNNVYSFAFREDRNYQIKIEAIKINPEDTVKWSFTKFVDPFFFGVDTIDFTTNVSIINIELGSQINISANISGVSTVCVDIDHPDYGNEYACGSPNAVFLFNISFFRRTVFNDSTTTQNISWNGGGNETLYILGHQYDDVLGLTINITGFTNNGTNPTDLKIYINNTLSNDLGIILTGGTVTINTLNDSSTAKNFTFATSTKSLTDYWRLFKTGQISNATINLTGRIIPLNYTKFVYDSTNDSIVDQNLWLNDSGLTGLGVPHVSETSIFLRVTAEVDSFATDSASLSTKDLPELSAINNITTNIKLSCFGQTTGTFTSFTFGGVVIKNLPPATCNAPPTVQSTSTWLFMKNETLGENRFDVFDDGVFSQQFLPASNIFVFSVSADGTKGSGASAAAFADIFYMNHSSNLEPTNVTLIVATANGTEEFTAGGLFLTKNTTANFNDTLMTYLDSDDCVADSDGYCTVPFFLGSATAGQILVDDIRIQITFVPNPITLNANLTRSFLGNSTDFANIPIKFETSLNGTLQVNDIRFDYAGGNGTIDILVYDNGTGANSLLVFNNSLQIENLTFTGNENITRYLDLSKLSNVTSSFLNLSGFGAYPPLHYWDLEDNSTDGTRDVFTGKINFTSSGSVKSISISCITNGCVALIDSQSTNRLTAGEDIFVPSAVNKTYSVWFNFTATNTEFVAIIGKGIGVTTSYLVQVNKTGSVQFSLPGITFPPNNTAGITEGLWHNLILRTNDTGTDIIIDKNIVFAEDGIPGATGVDILGDYRTISTNTGNITFDEVSFHNLSLNSTQISDLFDLRTLKDVVGMLETSLNDNITNPFLEIGTPDGNYEWNFTGDFNQTNNKTEDLSSSINTALNSGACDCTGCILATNCSIPFQFHSDTVGILQYDWQNIDYDILPDKSNNETLSIVNFFSKWNFNFPRFIDFFEMIPNTPISKNITPYGQTPNTPIFNMTTLNYGGRNMNLSIYLNESLSCVDLSINTNSTKPTSGSFYNITNQTWIDFSTNLEYLNNTKLWFWADYSCNASSWSVLSPDLFIRGACYECDAVSEDFL